MQYMTELIILIWNNLPFLYLQIRATLWIGWDIFF